MTYHQLTEHERYTIALMRKKGFRMAEIAEFLGRHRSTIYREVQRNSTPIGDKTTYCWSKAQKRRNGVLRRSREGRHHADWQYSRVEQLLKQDWSPEQVAGLLNKQDEFAISFQTIYRHVRRDWRKGGKLYLLLRRRYKRRKRHYGLERRGRLQDKRMIDERPTEVETRQETGHWEIDTVMGAANEKACILTLVERSTGYLMIGKLPNRTTRAVNRKTIALARSIDAPFLTITSDNGTEFHNYQKIEAATGATMYFAHPYHPWERGTNENTNGLIRQYLPKGMSMADLSQRQCNAIAKKINNRPRKRYDYNTPNQRLFNH